MDKNSGHMLQLMVDDMKRNRKRECWVEVIISIAEKVGEN